VGLATLLGQWRGLGRAFVAIRIQKGPSLMIGINGLELLIKEL